MSLLVVEYTLPLCCLLFMAACLSFPEVRGNAESALDIDFGMQALACKSFGCLPDEVHVLVCEVLHTAQGCSCLMSRHVCQTPGWVSNDAWMLSILPIQVGVLSSGQSKLGFCHLGHSYQSKLVIGPNFELTAQPRYLRDRFRCLEPQPKNTTC